MSSRPQRKRKTKSDDNDVADEAENNSEEQPDKEEEEEDVKPKKSRKRTAKKKKDDDDEEADEPKPKAKAKSKSKKAKKPVEFDMSYPGKQWKWEGTLLYWNNEESKASSKIAAFDFDGCLAKTAPMRKGVDAWSLQFPCIPKMLKELHESGYKIVIMTNQSDIGRMVKPETRTRAIDEKIGRLQAFVSKVDLPISVFIATSKSTDSEDLYRKPATGMWTFVVEKCNGDVKPDMAASFFVGDAAGRKKDHGETDKLFAEAVPLTFWTETDFFKDGKGVVKP